MNDASDTGRRFWTRRQRLVLRLIIFPVIILAVLWVQVPDGGDAPERPRIRQATEAEWARPIEELAEDRLAKQLVYQAQQVSYGEGFAGPRVDNVGAQGDLVWFHHPEHGEAVAYVPAAGEHAGAMAAALITGITRHRNVILYDLHGDPTLAARLGDLAAVELPPGWTILTRPAPSADPEQP